MVQLRYTYLDTLTGYTCDVEVPLLKSCVMVSPIPVLTNTVGTSRSSSSLFAAIFIILTQVMHLNLSAL